MTSLTGRSIAHQRRCRSVCDRQSPQHKVIHVCAPRASARIMGLRRLPGLRIRLTGSDLCLPVRPPASGRPRGAWAIRRHCSPRPCHRQAAVMDRRPPTWPPALARQQSPAPVVPFHRPGKAADKDPLAPPRQDRTSRLTAALVMSRTACLPIIGSVAGTPVAFRRLRQSGLIIPGSAHGTSACRTRPDSLFESAGFSKPRGHRARRVKQPPLCRCIGPDPRRPHRFVRHRAMFNREIPAPLHKFLCAVRGSTIRTSWHADHGCSDCSGSR